MLKAATCVTWPKELVIDNYDELLINRSLVIVTGKKQNVCL